MVGGSPHPHGGFMEVIPWPSPCNKNHCLLGEGKSHQSLIHINRGEGKSNQTNPKIPREFKRFLEKLNLLRQLDWEGNFVGAGNLTTVGWEV